MNRTIDYYNSHAEEYFANTVNVDFTDTYERFLRYIPLGGRIMDLGCGSGRDVAYFNEHGYEAYGLDASEELVKIANYKLGLHVEKGLIEEWIAAGPFDGIWCNASLLHLDEKEATSFFGNLRTNLKPGGVVFISVKCGIVSGLDEHGRHMKNYTQEELTQYLKDAGCEVSETSVTKDKLGRGGLSWLNVFAIMGTA